MWDAGVMRARRPPALQRRANAAFTPLWRSLGRRGLLRAGRLLLGRLHRLRVANHEGLRVSSGRERPRDKAVAPEKRGRFRAWVTPLPRVDAPCCARPSPRPSRRRCLPLRWLVSAQAAQRAEPWAPRAGTHACRSHRQRMQRLRTRTHDTQHDAPHRAASITARGLMRCHASYTRCARKGEERTVDGRLDGSVDGHGCRCAGAEAAGVDEERGKSPEGWAHLAQKAGPSGDDCSVLNALQGMAAALSDAAALRMLAVREHPRGKAAPQAPCSPLREALLPRRGLVVTVEPPASPPQRAGGRQRQAPHQQQSGRSRQLGVPRCMPHAARSSNQVPLSALCSGVDD